MGGDKGDAGTGLTLKKFKIGKTYKKGDYVFAKATRGSHHSMFIAENDFKAETMPSKDLDNWIGFQAPRGEKGEAGRDGKDGKQGATGAAGHDGKDGKQGAPGAAGRAGKDGKDGKKGDKGDAGTGLTLKKFKI